ncbi:MAG: hypothetical protein U0103_06740 [Candidatus Obscuribacterales bacterium]
MKKTISKKLPAFIFLIGLVLFFSTVDLKCDKSVSIQEEEFQAKQKMLEKKLKEETKSPPEVYPKSQ